MWVHTSFIHNTDYVGYLDILYDWMQSLLKIFSVHKWLLHPLKWPTMTLWSNFSNQRRKATPLNPRDKSQIVAMSALVVTFGLGFDALCKTLLVAPQCCVQCIPFLIKITWFVLVSAIVIIFRAFGRYLDKLTAQLLEYSLHKRKVPRVRIPLGKNGYFVILGSHSSHVEFAETKSFWTNSIKMCNIYCCLHSVR